VLVIKENVHYCDFCYSEMPIWEVKFRTRVDPFGWDLEICDSCRLLLRNIIGVVLHRLSHAEVVNALVLALNQKGLQYQDLMTSMVEIQGSKQKELDQ
jgi:hypothetical protein